MQAALNRGIAPIAAARPSSLAARRAVACRAQAGNGKGTGEAQLNASLVPGGWTPGAALSCLCRHEGVNAPV